VRFDLIEQLDLIWRGAICQYKDLHIYLCGPQS
jgi:hypothetical protein